MKAVQHIVNVSGGKDSDSVALLALERGVDFRLVMADTGNEHEATYEHARLLARHVGRPLEMVKADFTDQIRAKRMFIARDVRTGRKNGRRIRWTNKAKRRALAVLHPTGNPFLDLCLWKGRFPSRKAQFCTEELKVLAVLDQIVFPALRNGPVLQWLGERSEESPTRAAKPRFNRDDSGAWRWRPIKHWNIAMVLEIHRRHGLPMNPLYSQGMARVGCMPCFQAGKDEIYQITSRFPDYMERIAEWEAIVSEASKMRHASFFPPKAAGVKNTARDVAEWSRTARGGRQYDLVHEMEDTTSGCHSSYGLCE